MATKTGIGYSPLTEKVYLGRQNEKNRTWVGDKKDITQEFIAVAFQYFEVGHAREIRSGNGSENVFINVVKDKEGIELAISHLNKLWKKIK